MAIFQDADPQHHAITAVETALALLTTTAALNTVRCMPPLAIHMGLNSGRALVGSTRFEGRRGTRWTFTASGPVTNLALRLASLATAGQILLGPETARRLGQRYRLKQLSRTYLHNLAEPVDAYCVLGEQARSCERMSRCPPSHPSTVSSALASWRSAVSNPSVNQP
jgi:class 3 adenylate cyclase